jgi:ditrans,polycis-polyprenyl diphosphate synthase
MRRFYERWLVNILKSGPIPSHIAIIMDGNRRFARSHPSKKPTTTTTTTTTTTAIEGHRAGYGKLEQSLEWLFHLGVSHVTVFAFSIHNYLRDTQEVDDLMNLATEKLEKMLSDGDLIDKYNIRICVPGDLSLLPSRSLQSAIARAIHRTKDHTGPQCPTLHIAWSYASDAEMADVARSVAIGIESGVLEAGDATDELFSRLLWTEAPYSLIKTSKGELNEGKLHENRVPEPDLLIRTSGEVRLSDFLCWQTEHAHFAFVKSLWPELSFWDLVLIVLDFQRAAGSLAKERAAAERMNAQDQLVRDEKQAKVLGVDVNELVQKRRQRQDVWVARVFQKRVAWLEQMLQGE